VATSRTGGAEAVDSREPDFVLEGLSTRPDQGLRNRPSSQEATISGAQVFALPRSATIEACTFVEAFEESEDYRLESLPQIDAAGLTPILSLSPEPRLRAGIEILKQWEGTVTAICGSEFTAVLRPLRDADISSRLEADFPVRSVSGDDRSLLKTGAVFTWTVQRETAQDGQVMNVAFLKFQRLPAWSQGDVARIEARAAELEDLFSGRS
jgi:hypothetical protein